jgi:hypothetical protein
MTGPDPRDRLIESRSRTIGAVILATIGLWVLVQYLGARYGVPARWMGLADLAALGALAWAVIVAIRTFVRRNKE